MTAVTSDRATSIPAGEARMSCAARIAKYAKMPLFLVIATITIVLSWAFIHTMFALHYAHEFYDETSGGGLAFPGGDAEPDYLDFVYFSFVIGMTSQVSDVAVTSKRIRRTVTAHGAVSFGFNARAAGAHGEHRGQRDLADLRPA